ncbi:MAG: aldo/keto reductase [Candidatus Curtissbacteria bacterium]|nr:aldo/keto reductase [Candidatus Curtissbacteria bacterium]
MQKSSFLKLPPIGQGTGFDFSKVSQKKFIYLLQKGVSLGMTFIDTAESYGDGLAEKLVGAAIKKNRAHVIVGTKFSPEHSSYGSVIAACNASLERLSTDYIDLYQVHWPNYSVSFEETFRALSDLVGDGKVRYIGVGNFSQTELQRASKLLGKIKLASIQSEYNIFERSVEYNGVFDYCQQNNLQLVAFSPLDQGRIGSMSPLQKELIEGLAIKYGKSGSQIILNWLTKNRYVTGVPMTLNESHLIENSLAASFVMTKSEYDKIDKAFFAKLLSVPVEKIRVSAHGERDSRVYQTIDEALENKLNFNPSPKELADVIKEGGLLKPVRLVRAKGSNKYDFDLISGRIRYWAWVIAYEGKRPIPAHVREYI